MPKSKSKRRKPPRIAPPTPELYSGYVLAIDPSIRALGWCLGLITPPHAKMPHSSYSQISTVLSKCTARVVGSGVIKNPPPLIRHFQGPSAPWIPRVLAMEDALFRTIIAYLPDSPVPSQKTTPSAPHGSLTPPGPTISVVVELPEAFSSAKGRRAQESGDIIKLSGVAFYVAGALGARKCVRAPFLVPVRRWKGTTPKEITQRRVRKHWGLSPSDHNEADGIGIFDWYIRKYLKIKPLRQL